MHARNSTYKEPLVDVGTYNPEVPLDGLAEALKRERQTKAELLRKQVIDKALQGTKSVQNLTHARRLWNAFYISPYLNTLTAKDYVAVPLLTRAEESDYNGTSSTTLDADNRSSYFDTNLYNDNSSFDNNQVLSSTNYRNFAEIAAIQKYVHKNVLMRHGTFRDAALHHQMPKNLNNLHHLTTEQLDTLQQELNNPHSLYNVTLPFNKKKNNLGVMPKKDEPDYDRPAFADLYIKIPWKKPLLEQRQCKNKGFPTNYRHEGDYIDAQAEEDKILLFDRPSFNPLIAYPTRCEKQLQKYDYELDNEVKYDSKETRIRRWLDIKQGRYFWDFLAGLNYDIRDGHDLSKSLKPKYSEDVGSHRLREKELKRRFALHRQKQILNTLEAKQKREEEDEKMHQLLYEPQRKVVVPFEFLPSIYPSPPPPRRHLALRHQSVPAHRLYDFGLEIEKICSVAPIVIDFQRWTQGRLKHPLKVSKRSAVIIDYLRSKGQLPAGMKSFEETYPNLSKAVLERLQKERQEKEALEAEAKRKGIAPVDLLYPEKREARKIAGGRYALR